ncbi:MAG: hypothetical protein LBT44_10135, partial [Clostridiales bacterium]|nr:hypothetical protein [Clostridiales bacterium]
MLALAAAAILAAVLSVFAGTDRGRV